MLIEAPVAVEPSAGWPRDFQQHPRVALRDLDEQMNRTSDKLESEIVETARFASANFQKLQAEADSLVATTKAQGKELAVISEQFEK